MEGERMSDECYGLKIIRLEGGEIEVVGNRTGLRELAAICVGLANLSDEEAKTAANHFHFADFMNTADDGSLELIVRVDPEL
jgi:hypothetical protein